MADTAKTLDPQVLERLGKIDWKSVESSYGITREQIEKKPNIASQLVYGAMTDLVPFNNGVISGEISLRAFPTPADSNKLWGVKGYTKQAEKKEEDKLFYYGEEIYSKAAKKNLFEMTSWVGTDGQRKYGRANASTGIPVSFAFKKRDENGNVVMGADGKPEREEKKSYILSIHGATNQVVGISVDKLKARLSNGNVQKYGVKLTEEQVNQICNGGAVILKGTKNKNGEAFESFPGIGTPVQFDVAQMQLVAVHPTALKQVQKMGAGVSETTEAPKQDAKKAEGAKKTTKKAAAQTEAPAKKTRMKR